MNRRRPTNGADRVLLGAMCGLAWAAGFRGLMAEIAGPTSQVSWLGTFGHVLLPGVVCGALLGWAEYLRTTGGRRGWRWLALSPLAFAAVLFSDPAGFAAIFSDGLGAGAIAVPVFAMLGGYAFSGRGPWFARLAAGLVLLAGLASWGIAAPLISPELALATPRGAWVALFYWSFLIMLALAAGIPHRPAQPPGVSSQPRKSDDATSQDHVLRRAR